MRWTGTTYRNVGATRFLPHVPVNHWFDTADRCIIPSHLISANAPYNPVNNENIIMVERSAAALVRVGAQVAARHFFRGFEKGEGGGSRRGRRMKQADTLSRRVMKNCCRFPGGENGWRTTVTGTGSRGHPQVTLLWDTTSVYRIKKRNMYLKKNKIK